METPLGPGDDLREHERAAALPYTEYPPLPAWYPVATGIWAAMFLACFLYLFRQPLFFPVIAVLIAVEIGVFTWYRRKRGNMPSLRGAPPEIDRVFRLYYAGLLGVVAVVVAATVLLPPLAAVLVCFTLVTAGLTAYERVYRDAAAATRARLR